MIDKKIKVLQFVLTFFSFMFGFTLFQLTKNSAEWLIPQDLRGLVFLSIIPVFVLLGYTIFVFVKTRKEPFSIKAMTNIFIFIFLLFYVYSVGKMIFAYFLQPF